MKKVYSIALLIGLIFLIGCAELQKVRGVNFTMKNNGDERTFALGNGWKYTHTITVTNGEKGVVADVTARRGDSGFKKVAELRPGEIYSETIESSMCYGNRRWASYWRNNPPVTTYIINRFEVVGDKNGKGLKEFIESNQIVVKLFSCNKALNQVTGIILGHHNYSGGIRIIHE